MTAVPGLLCLVVVLAVVAGLLPAVGLFPGPGLPEGCLAQSGLDIDG